MFDTIEDGTRGLTVDDALARFREHNVPAAPCITMDEHLVDPQVAHNELYAISVWAGLRPRPHRPLPRHVRLLASPARRTARRRASVSTPARSSRGVMADLAIVAPAYVELAHRIVWATVATVDSAERPRSRVLWDLFARTPEPLGYDPAIIPQWAGGPTSAAFAVLRLEPWRLRVLRALGPDRPPEVLAWPS